MQKCYLRLLLLMVCLVVRCQSFNDDSSEEDSFFGKGIFELIIDYFYDSSEESDEKYLICKNCTVQVIQSGTSKETTKPTSTDAPTTVLKRITSALTSAPTPAPTQTPTPDATPDATPTSTSTTTPSEER